MLTKTPATKRKHDYPFRRQYRKATTWADVTPPEYERVDMREYRVTASENLAAGRSRIWLRCPWCSKEQEARVWSLRGSGKKCSTRECGAIFGSSGMGYRLKDEFAQVPAEAP